jgi:hypothetical protein
MMKEENEARVRREQDFYNRVAEILHTDYNYTVPYYRKTRWNARLLGNGRFPGYGIIRMHGPNMINVMLNHPERVSRFFTSTDEIYDFLKIMMARHS